MSVKDVLPEQGPSSRIGRAHASSGYETHRLSFGRRSACSTTLATQPALLPSKLRMEASSRKGESSNVKKGFQFGTRDLRSETVSELSSPFLCQVRVILATLVGLRGASSWTSPSSISSLTPFLSPFRFLPTGLVYTGVGGIGVGGRGTIGTSRVTVQAWDSSRESKSSNLFSITIPSGTSIASWSSLTRAATGYGLSPSSSDSFVR